VLKAVLFDCDGVIADTERIHFGLFRTILAEELGLELDWAEYLDRYLAMDDRGCFAAVARARGRALTENDLRRLIAKKTELYKKEASRHLVILPGVVEFVMAAAQKYPLAVASGALRQEVLMVLDAAGIRPYFDGIVAAEDVANGKPAPDAYLKAMAVLNAKFSGKGIRPEECLVIEDSRHGVASARAAGMKCLALSTSYPAEALSAADKTVANLAAVRLSEVEALFAS
jgi:HAD superfamily hydrolase (TIGR01509 family)